MQQLGHLSQIAILLIGPSINWQSLNNVYFELFYDALLFLWLVNRNGCVDLSALTVALHHKRSSYRVTARLAHPCRHFKHRCSRYLVALQVGRGHGHASVKWTFTSAPRERDVLFQSQLHICVELSPPNRWTSLACICDVNKRRVESAEIPLRARFIVASLVLRWCRTQWVWCTSRWRGPKMLWWGLWWVVWSWPGQRSAEVSSAPWAPGWARWSAVGWAWHWADPRTGSTRTCHSLRRSWVSSCMRCGKHNRSIKKKKTPMGGDEPIAEAQTGCFGSWLK